MMVEFIVGFVLGAGVFAAGVMVLCARYPKVTSALEEAIEKVRNHIQRDSHE